jgi:hypothetical protein
MALLRSNGSVLGGAVEIVAGDVEALGDARVSRLLVRW